MRSATRWASAAAAIATGAALFGCSKQEEAKATPPTASTDAAPAASGAASSAPSASTTPSAAASAPPVECPKGSSGEGSFTKPCEAKGPARIMTTIWTGKTDDKGPFFNVVNKSSSVVLYGRMAVYFYDKAGKQLQVKDASGKTAGYHTCSGNMFGGVMKGGEKAVIQFSCVGKNSVPEGATAIEAEMAMVGFADESQKKVASYWRNADLMPDTRKKGGIK